MADERFENPVPTYRRYLLFKQLEAGRLGEWGLEATWRGMRGALPPGTSLPTNFPFRAKLLMAGYMELELLNGATVEELYLYAQLGSHDAQAVIAAYTALVQDV